ncbi:MAG: hypothetical protein R8G66_12945 [Cytophagales bacterium]|nr:hypothetical protein [Cytophagales bacterium]
MKLLEITCRFAFNGYFQQAIFEQMSKDYLKVQRSNVATEHPYDELFGYLFPSISKYNKLIVLQGEDQKNESKLIAPYLSKIGVELIRVPYQEASTLNANLETSIILSELGFDEILAMEKSVLSRMIQHNFWNDLRTVFLIHDKRFFSVLYNDSFRKDVLSSQEDEFFKSFLLPSYNYAVGSDIWREARDNRSCWIMKSSSLGKSQGVYAGALTSEEEWHQLFASNAKEQMVLQKWVPTTRVSGTIGSQKYHDYLTGTLLFLDDQYFGLGEFRTSSYPITNKVDHRKAFSVTLRETVEPDFQYLKFI